MAAAKKGGKKSTAKKIEKKVQNKSKETETGRKKKPTVKKTTPKTEKTAKKKKAKFECQHCGKVVTTAHNLKVHEQHCKKKAIEKEEKVRDKEIEAAVRKLRDEFDDQHEALEQETRNRENTLRDEIRELKDVLRLEIRRIHHVNAPKPEPEHGEAESAASEHDEKPVEVVKHDPKVEHLDMDDEPELEPSTQIVETPAVVEPRPVEEVAEPVETPVSAPEPIVPQPTPVAEAVVPDHPILEHDVVIDVPTEKGVEPDAMPATAQTSIVPENLAELVKAEIEKLGLTKSGAVVEGVDGKTLEEMASRVDALSSELSDFRRNTNERHDDLSRKIDERLQNLNVKRYERELEKVSERVFDIMDEVGFGESLDVSKIPPNILEIVYQATLEDVVQEMIHSLGNQEAERNVNSALEEVRLKTSGSELFRFDGRKIVTENLARSLETNLISAKQIQTTYRELLNKLLDNVPHHKAKNFRAMIKIKSQEYAVDKATVLMGEVERLSNFAETTSHMIAALSGQLNSRAVQMESEFAKSNTAIDGKIGREELDIINNKFDERLQTETRLAEDIGKLKAEVEMLRQLVGDVEKKMAEGHAEKKEKTDKKGAKTGDDEKPDDKKKDAKKPDEKDKEPKTKPAEEKVLAEVRRGASSKTAVMKGSGLSKDEVEKTLAALVKSKSIIKKGPKNRPVYSTPADDFAEVVKKSEKKGKKAERKKDEEKKKEEREAVKEDKKKPKADDKKAPAEKKVEPTDDKKEGEKSDKKGKAAQKKKGEKEGAKEENKPSKKDKPADKKEPVKEEKQEKESIQKKDEKKSSKSKKKAAEEKKEEKKEAEKDEIAEEKKGLKDLTGDEKLVYDAIPNTGITLLNLRKNVEKDVKYTVVLRTLRVLIDSELIEVKTRGRHTLYHKIKVAKTGKTEKSKNKKEVK